MGWRAAGRAWLFAIVLASCGDSGDDRGTSPVDAGDDTSAGSGGVGGTGGGAAGTGGGGTGAGGTGGTVDAGGMGGSDGALGGTGGNLVDGCTPKPPEICNGEDDDCDGLVDDVDLTAPEHCGTCVNNCFNLKAVVVSGCTPPAVLDGKTPGKCNYSCAPDSYDIVKDDSKWSTAGCEYFCPWNPNGTNTKDLGGPFDCGKDNDCDGKVDEDVDLCGVTDCGKCGVSCANLPHAQGMCAKAADAGAACTPTNSGCAVLKCDPGWVNENLSTNDGCEKAAPDAG